MCEIRIKIPNNKRHQSLVTDTTRADARLQDLDRSSVRAKKDPAHFSPSQLEDIRDGEAARRNLEEMKSTGVSHTVDELRKEFGLS
jgi:hypothetical protein